MSHPSLSTDYFLKTRGVSDISSLTEFRLQGMVPALPPIKDNGVFKFRFHQALADKLGPPYAPPAMNTWQGGGKRVVDNFGPGDSGVNKYVNWWTEALKQPTEKPELEVIKGGAGPFLVKNPQFPAALEALYPDGGAVGGDFVNPKPRDDLISELVGKLASLPETTNMLAEANVSDCEELQWGRGKKTARKTAVEGDIFSFSTPEEKFRHWMYKVSYSEPAVRDRVIWNGKKGLFSENARRNLISLLPVNETMTVTEMARVMAKGIMKRHRVEMSLDEAAGVLLRWKGQLHYAEGELTNVGNLEHRGWD